MLTNEETKTAAAQGWLVCEVWCLETRKLNLRILATTTGPHKNWHNALQFVTDRAKSLDPTAIRALKLVMDSLQPKPKTNKK